MKKMIVCIMFLISLTLLGNEFLMIYPNALAIKGGTVAVQSENYQLEIPDSWLSDSFSSDPYPQSYQHVIVESFNYDEALRESVGQTIKWRFNDGTTKPFTLLLNQPVLLSDNNGVFIPNEGTAVFETVNIRQPHQYLDLDFKNYIDKVDFSYMFTNLSYQTIYNMNLDETNHQVDIFGTLVINNQTTKDIQTDNLFIFSGDPNRVSSNYAMKAARSYLYDSEMSSIGVTAENISDYKIYSIPGTFCFSKSTADYIQFFSAKESYETIYTFNTHYSNYNSDFESLDQTIKISKLSQDLMAGKIRLQNKTDGKTVFLGENTTGNSNKGQALEISFGKAYDLQGKVELIQSNRSGNTYFEAYKFTTKNFSDEEKTIQLNFTLPRDSDVEVDVYDFERPSATLLQIPLILHSNMEAEITFEIRYDR
ncbi:MAG TPA: hypothetical protein P5107_00660 [Thermotogota bacterium]|nr:hypothetical protein [Thermotogota bacterium]